MRILLAALSNCAFGDRRHRPAAALGHPARRPARNHPNEGRDRGMRSADQLSRADPPGRCRRHRRAGQRLAQASSLKPAARRCCASARRNRILQHSSQAGTGSAAGPTGLPTVTSSGLPASPPAPSKRPRQDRRPRAWLHRRRSPERSGSRELGAGRRAAGPAQRHGHAGSGRKSSSTCPPPTIRCISPIEIVVRMPPPDVNVSVARPEVQVSVPQPVVQVVPPPAPAQPQVRTEEPQPSVRLERTGEPRIVYQPAEGPPQVRFENAAGETAAQPTGTAAPQPQTAQTTGAAPSGASGPVSPTGAQAQLNSGQAVAGSAGTAADGRAAPARPAGEPAQTGALPGEMRALKVSELEDMGVYNGRGEKLGEVEKMLMGADNKPYFLVSHGGFGTRLEAGRDLVGSDRAARRPARRRCAHRRAGPRFPRVQGERELQGDGGRPDDVRPRGSVTAGTWFLRGNRERFRGARPARTRNSPPLPPVHEPAWL